MPKQYSSDDYANNNAGEALYINHLIKERDEARIMVLRLVVARYRQGWEKGNTEEEEQSCARDFLYNCGLDPHCNKEACKEILEKHNPEVSLAQMRSNQELREAAEQECQSCEEENEKLRETLKDGTIHCETDGEEIQETYISFSNTLRELAKCLSHDELGEEWEDWLVCKADDIDKALGNKGE